MKQGQLGKYLLLILPLVIAVWTLYPTYFARSLKSDRNAMLETVSDSVERAQKLQTWNETNGEDYQDYKQKAIKFGLDLEGGMYVTMAVDLVKLIEETAQNDAKDEVFLEVMEKTKAEALATQDDAIDIFVKNFREIAVPQKRDFFDYFDLGDLELTNEEDIVDKLRENSVDAVDQAMQVLSQRINKYKVSEPNISKQGNDRIVLEIPGVTNESEVRDLLQTTARLNFHLVRNNSEIVSAFAEVDDYLKAERERKENGGSAAIEEPPVAADTVAVNADEEPVVAGEVGESTDTTARTDDSLQLAETDTVTAAEEDTTNEDPYAGLSTEEAEAKFQKEHPFTSLFATTLASNGQQINYDAPSFPDVEYIFRIPEDKIDEFEALMARPDIRGMIPSKFLISIEANPNQYITDPSGREWFDFWSLEAEASLTGDVIVDAGPNFDPTTNSPIVQMTMNSEGSDRWAAITGANVKKRIAIVLDNRVYSAPVVQQRITGGQSQITGSKDIKEARILAIVLKAGALKAPVEIIEERIVGPSLGEDSIKNGVQASVAAFLLVLLFMAIYYAASGMVADLAVFFNVGLILTLLAAFGGTLTLPGIAGLILTIGMAVDANILIFERVREELSLGRSLRSAIDEGYGKALSAILDSNITTFITGVILFYFGSGPIQGFAVTLMIGIIMTLFTAIMVTRAIIELYLSRGATGFNFGQPKHAAA